MCVYGKCVCACIIIHGNECLIITYISKYMRVMSNGPFCIFSSSKDFINHCVCVCVYMHTFIHTYNTSILHECRAWHWFDVVLILHWWGTVCECFHPADMGALLMRAPQAPLLSPCVRTASLESIPRHQVCVCVCAPICIFIYLCRCVCMVSVCVRVL